MRKNKGNREGVSGVKVTYEVNGLNLDRLVNYAKKKGLTLYGVKKYGNKRLIVSVSLRESKKFFAIAKELCYNIKKVKEFGVVYPLLKLSRSIGLFIGAVIITLTAVYFDGSVLSITYSGTGAVYRREVSEYLDSLGIKKLSRFQNFSLSALEDGILADNPHLSFVSCKKVGSNLQIELVLAKDSVDRLSGKVYSMQSDCSGVVEDIKVYRGTALVEVGQTVEKGDILVGGYAEIKDKRVETSVLAVVVLSCERVTEYRSQNGDDKNGALIFAVEQLGDATIAEQKVFKKRAGEEYIYTVVTKYKRILSVG